VTGAGVTELGPSGIGVHLVLPGTIDTPMAWGAVADVADVAEVKSVEEVAQVMAFLAFGAASRTTDTDTDTVNVTNGGATLGIARRGGDRR